VPIVNEIPRIYQKILVLILELSYVIYPIVLIIIYIVFTSIDYQPYVRNQYCKDIILIINGLEIYTNQLLSLVCNNVIFSFRV